MFSIQQHKISMTRSSDTERSRPSIEWIFHKKTGPPCGEPENNQLFFEVVERLDAVVFRYIAEHVFDAEKLVIFRDTVCT